MNNNDEKRFLADISHELRSRIDAILSYGKLISSESADPAVREYAARIGSAAAGVNSLIDGILDKAADYGGSYGRPLPAAAPAADIYPSQPEETGTPLVLIVDDDELICESAAAILGRIFRTDMASGGEEALEKLPSVRPSLILLDVNMPDMDGFETAARIRSTPGFSSVPVVFLTGDEDRDIEIRCLKAGASDFVRKPLVSQVLTERVRRIIELDRLRNFLSSEVAAQTRRSVHLSEEIMLALSKAVDAKDHYTNGHSQRVASYSAEIARRMGKSLREQEDIYAMGLLHDVGKIGVSEAIINKTSRLDYNEYAQIKTHTTIGYDILKIITEIPGLATGARWHHERYDGRGYPDGLSGKDIPEEARIICVADCYDAMTSNRSYSNAREQSAVRAEMLRCRGTQFDPDIADIMIAMIDDDKDYEMSERSGHNASVPAFSRSTSVQSAGDASAPELLAAEEAGKKPFIPVVNGMDIEYARKNVSDEDILAATLRRFWELMPSKLKKLRASYEELIGGGSADSYRIDVHSMKSSSAAVGLTTLSEVARALEMMAKDGDIAGITSLHGPFAAEWEHTCGLLAEEYRKADGESAESAGDGTEALPELLTMLRMHMENMDIDAADGVMKLIGAYSYSPAVQLLTEELGTAVLSLDEESMNDTAEKILKEIGR